MRPVIQTPSELAEALGYRIRSRRLAYGWTQKDAAGRAGVAYRTWRRLETAGEASIDDLVRAAIALRCDHELALLFSAPVASSMDELLARRQPARKLRARPSLKGAAP